MKFFRPVIASDGAPYLQMASIVWHNTSGREKEGKNGEEEDLVKSVSAFRKMEIIQDHLNNINRINGKKFF